MDLFLSLSVHLIGLNSLPKYLAEQHLQRVQRQAPELWASIVELLAIFEEISLEGGDIDAGIRERIFGTPLRASARRIIILWYLGELVNEKDETLQGLPEDNFRGLMWEMIHAHPLGLSGGYFGYWKYPPEN